MTSKKAIGFSLLDATKSQGERHQKMKAIGKLKQSVEETSKQREKREKEQIKKFQAAIKAGKSDEVECSTSNDKKKENNADEEITSGGILQFMARFLKHKEREATGEVFAYASTRWFSIRPISYLKNLEKQVNAVISSSEKDKNEHFIVLATRIGLLLQYFVESNFVLHYQPARIKNHSGLARCTNLYNWNAYEDEVGEKLSEDPHYLVLKIIWQLSDLIPQKMNQLKLLLIRTYFQRKHPKAGKSQIENDRKEMLRSLFDGSHVKLRNKLKNNNNLDVADRLNNTEIADNFVLQNIPASSAVTTEKSKSQEEEGEKIAGNVEKKEKLNEKTDIQSTTEQVEHKKVKDPAKHSKRSSKNRRKTVALGENIASDDPNEDLISANKQENNRIGKDEALDTTTKENPLKSEPTNEAEIRVEKKKKRSKNKEQGETSKTGKKKSRVGKKEEEALPMDDEKKQDNTNAEKAINASGLKPISRSKSDDSTVEQRNSDVLSLAANHSLSSVANDGKRKRSLPIIHKRKTSVVPLEPVSTSLSSPAPTRRGSEKAKAGGMWEMISPRSSSPPPVLIGPGGIGPLVRDYTNPDTGEQEFLFFGHKLSNFAKIITYEASYMFNLLTVGDVLNDKNKGAFSRLQNMVDLFNSFSYWIVAEVVKEEDVNSRKNLIRAFIYLARTFLELNNFQYLMAVLSGLNMNPVLRLKKTWKMIPTSSMAELESLSKIMSSSSNFEGYRLAKEKVVSKGLPLIPFTGVLQKDVLAICENQPNFNEDTKKINFVKLRSAGTILEEVRKQQEASLQASYTISFAILQIYFERCASEALEDFHDQSLKIEPPKD